MKKLILVLLLLCGASSLFAQTYTPLYGTSLKIKNSLVTPAKILTFDQSGITSDYTLKWPAGIGASGDFLKLGTSGQLEWGTPPPSGDSAVFISSPSSVQTFNNGAVTSVLWGTPSINNIGTFDGQSLTITRAGTYLLSANVAVTNGNNVGICVNVNGTPTLVSGGSTIGGSFFGVVRGGAGVSNVITLSANDIVQVFFCTSGTSGNSVPGAYKWSMIKLAN